MESVYLVSFICGLLIYSIGATFNTLQQQGPFSVGKIFSHAKYSSIIKTCGFFTGVFTLIWIVTGFIQFGFLIGIFTFLAAFLGAITVLFIPQVIRGLLTIFSLPIALLSSFLIG
jgi:hypothetical protein